MEFSDMAGTVTIDLGEPLFEFALLDDEDSDFSEVCTKAFE